MFRQHILPTIQAILIIALCSGFWLAVGCAALAFAGVPELQ